MASANRAVHTWELCDQNGATLTELTTAAGKTLAFQRNSYAEATFAVSHEDEAASLLLGTLKVGTPRLRVFRDGVLRFNGWLAPFQEQAEENALLTAVFRSPFARLIGDGSNRGRFTGEVQDYVATDAGQIAKSLIDLANAQGDTGLTTAGTIEATKARDRTYTYANIGEAIVNLTNVLDGFDFDETFVDLGTTLAQFNVYASMGGDRPDARFEYGPDTLRNVRSVSRTTQPPINSARVLGGNGLVGSALNAASIVQYGLHPLQVSATDVIEQATLDDKALALLRPNPVKTEEFAPDFGLPNCPRPWDDFWIGDTVRCYVRRGAFEEDVAVHVNGLTVVVDENGYETLEIQDPRTGDEEATIRAQLSLEVEAE